jgi:pyruvate dehydrogenase E2 component (dihydrolipoamide acetyltransferase)
MAPKSKNSPASVHDAYERLSFTERWMRDILSSAERAGSLQTLEVDMTACKKFLAHMSKKKIRITYTHIFVRATALALSRHPELHQLVCDTRRLIPGTVDIGLSVSGDLFLAPVYVIEDAANKRIYDIARDIREGAEKAREQQEFIIKLTKYIGWMLPIGFLRRLELRFLMNILRFRRKMVGTFQLTCLPNLDVVVSYMFNTSAILGVGQVKDRVIAVNGKPAVRPTAILSCSTDHKCWDGMRVVTFLTEIEKILTSNDL